MSLAVSLCAHAAYCFRSQRWTFPLAVKDQCTMSLSSRPSRNTVADHCDEPNEVAWTFGRFPPWISTISATLLTVVFIGAGSMALIHFASSMARQDQLAGSDSEPGGSGIMIRTEVIRLYVPQALIELAHRQTEQPSIRTHEDLRQRLEMEHHQNLSYAVTARGLQVNGEFVDLRFIRKPYSDPARFAEFLDVLAAARGNPPHDFEQATIEQIFDESSERELREVMSKLLEQPQLFTKAGSRP